MCNYGLIISESTTTKTLSYISQSQSCSLPSQLRTGRESPSIRLCNAYFSRSTEAEFSTSATVRESTALLPTLILSVYLVYQCSIKSHHRLNQTGFFYLWEIIIVLALRHYNLFIASGVLNSGEKLGIRSCIRFCSSPSPLCLTSQLPVYIRNRKQWR